MKTLLLTSATALTITCATSAFAEHNTFNQDGQEQLAYGNYGYGNSYTYGFGNGFGAYPVSNPQMGDFPRFTPGYTPLNSGWSVGQFQPQWNTGYGNAGYGNGIAVGGCRPPIAQSPCQGGLSNCNQGMRYRPYPTGNCLNVGGQTYCPNGGSPRVYQPYSGFGLLGYGNLR